MFLLMELCVRGTGRGVEDINASAGYNYALGGSSEDVGMLNLNFLCFKK